MDENGNIVAIGENVILWITEGDIEAGRVSDQIPKDQIKVYTNGNPSGDESHSDVFLIHEGSGYWQDGNFRDLNSIKGNTTSASGPNGDARDTIYVQDDGQGWHADKGPANVNGNINYVDNVTITIGGKTIVQGSNSISDVTSSDGGQGWDPNAPESKTSWHYELSLDASVNGGGEHDQITSITLSGLPQGTIEYNGQTYTVDANGHVVIDVDDTTNLNANITLTTDNQVNLDDVKVDIETSVNGEHHDSGDIAVSDDHHSITLSGSDADTSTTQESHDADVLTTSADEHHDTSDSDTTHDTQSQSETTDATQSVAATSSELVDEQSPHHDVASQETDNTADTHASVAENDTTVSGDDTQTESSEADNSHASLIDSEDLYLTPTETVADSASTPNDAATADSATETSLSNLVGGEDASTGESQTVTANVAESATDNSDADHGDSPASATTLSSEEPLNFSDIIHDESSDDDLGKLLPVADVSAESSNATDQIVSADSAADGNDAYTGGDDAHVDNLIAKPDTDS